MKMFNKKIWNLIGAVAITSLLAFSLFMINLNPDQYEKIKEYWKEKESI